MYLLHLLFTVYLSFFPAYKLYKGKHFDLFIHVSHLTGTVLVHSKKPTNIFWELWLFPDHTFTTKQSLQG